MAAHSGPLVSVVVPTYYRNDELEAAIESVRAQTYDPVEIVVVDDSGEGHARSVLDGAADVEYVELEANRGSNRARSTGAERASGAYVNFLDDDDRMFEEKLERQVAVAEANDDVGVVYCGIETTGGYVDRPRPDARGDVLERALRFDMWPCMTSTMLIDSGVLEEILPLPVRPGGDDLDMMIQLARSTEFDYVDRPLLFKELREDSRGHSEDAVRERFQIIEDFDGVYSTFPEDVRRSALAGTYEDLVSIELMRRPWSARAIVAAAHHVYYSSWTDPRAQAKLVASIFGSAGWDLLQHVGQSRG